MIFGHDVDHAPTHKLKAGLFNFFVLVRDRNNDPGKHKSDRNLSLKKKRKKADFQFFCTCGPTARFNFQIEKRKIQRGIAEMPFPPFFVEKT